MLRVKATRPGVYGKHREAKEVFTIDGEHHLGSWMEVLEDEKPKPQPKPKAKPKAKRTTKPRAE